MNWCSASSKPTRKMTARVDVQIACDESDLPANTELGDWVDRALTAAAYNGDAEVSIRIVSVDEVQALNRDFRRKDKPTNVLSFPAGAIDGLPDDVERPLGDIVVCASVVSDEALQQNKPLASHWAHMIVHGTLHLLGYDHETDAQALQMEGLESKILTTHGVSNPYRESPSET